MVSQIPTSLVRPSVRKPRGSGIGSLEWELRGIEVFEVGDFFWEPRGLCVFFMDAD